MSYARTMLFKVGPTGLTVKVALLGDDDVIHATARDLATAERPTGSGCYRLVASALPSAFRGLAVAYTGTLAAAANFAGVTVLDATAVNPGDFEDVGAIRAKTDLLVGAATYSGPVESVVDPEADDDDEDAPTTYVVRLVAGDDYSSAGNTVRFEFEGYTGPNLSGGTGSFRMGSVATYNATAAADDAPAELVASATVSQAGDVVTFEAQLSNAQTDALSVPKGDNGVNPTHWWQAVGTSSGGKIKTIRFGRGYVTRRLTSTVPT